MAFGTDKRLKVVWLCHLNNDYISQRLGVKSSFEFAPWISRFAEIFEQYNEVDVHIVAPHNQIIQNKSFAKNNIQYHFFPYLIPYIPRRIFHWLHRNTNYIWNKWRIRRIVNKIEPDLIHLFGTENAYFTSAVFQFKNKYPVFITIQGFASHTYSINKQTVTNRRYEIKLLRSFCVFGVRDQEMKNFILSHNPNASFLNHEIAPYKPKVIKDYNREPKYDIIFFGRVCKEKGIEDLLQAVSIVKKAKENISLIVVGPIARDYLEKLKAMTKQYKVEDNVYFEGLKETLDDVHKIAIECSICILPTYADTIPGTIIESMYMRVPCISYPVGGIPTLNETEEVIKLVGIGCIEDLSEAILELIFNKEKQFALANRANKYIKDRWGENGLYNSIIESYKKVLQND